MRRLITLSAIMSIIIMISRLPLFPADRSERREVRAVRAVEPISLDGLLNEKAWQGEGTGSFIQSEPDDGAPATEKTTVWVAYDNKAVYIGARMFDSEPSKIISLLGRRDNFVDSDWFVFSVDPYYDRVSGYQFAVNPAGCMVDWTLYNDEESDDSWDSVWDCRTNIDDKGWTVEIKIPFGQLRFKKKEHIVWGVNFRRQIKRKNEMSGLVWIPKGESGFVSHFAKLTGLTGVHPKRLLEVVPYTVAKAEFSTEEEGNPFETGKDYTANGGVDVKVGLKSNLTLDLTVNPDFGQVEVDPAVINLSAAENYYGEKRPFFLEGANIFRFGKGGVRTNIGANWGDPRFFYSRRIGRPPQGSANTGGYARYPEWTTILSAAKVTGKIGKGWNIGVLSAVTEREYADIDENGERSKQEVEPFTYYGVVRAQKEFNKGRQGLGFIATSVLRNLRTDDLKDYLPDSALSFALDGWTTLDKNRTWVISGYWGTTRISGSKTAIAGRQTSYPQYFQRPDATHVEFDENATSMTGWTGRLTLNKQRGNFVFNVALGAISPGFDSTDMGFLWGSDIINGHIMIGYRWYKPGKIFRSWSVLLFTQRNYNFGGDKIGEQRLIFIGNAKLLNYWDIYFQCSLNPEHWSHEFTRGGVRTLAPAFSWYDFTISSDSRKPVVGEWGGYIADIKSGTFEYASFLDLRWKSGENFSLSVRPSFRHNKIDAQWVSNIDDPAMTETSGTRHVYGKLDQKTLSCTIRLNWIFSPRLSLQAYIQPFISVGSFSEFKELARPSTYEFNRYGTGDSTISYDEGNDTYMIDPDGSGGAPVFAVGNPDFNYKSLRGTVVLRWEYRPGSTLYLVWTQNRADYSHPGDFRFGRDFGNLLKAPGDNIFMAKFTYRFKL